MQYQKQQLLIPEPDDVDDYAVDSDYQLPSDEDDSYRYVDMQSQLQNRAFLERSRRTSHSHPKLQKSLSDLLWGEGDSSARSSPSEKYSWDSSHRRVMKR